MIIKEIGCPDSAKDAESHDLQPFLKINSTVPVKLTGQKIRECLNHSDGFPGVAVDFIGSFDSQQSAADNDSVLTMIFQPGSERIYIIHSPYSEYSL